jgi:hypothetical protein
LLGILGLFWRFKYQARLPAALEPRVSAVTANIPAFYGNYQVTVGGQ